MGFIEELVAGVTSSRRRARRVEGQASSSGQALEVEVSRYCGADAMVYVDDDTRAKGTAFCCEEKRMEFLNDSLSFCSAGVWLRKG
jgi:hypothetical protein